MLQYFLKEASGGAVDKGKFKSVVGKAFPKYASGPSRETSNFSMEIYKVVKGNRNLGRIDIAYKDEKTHMVITSSSERNEKSLLRILKKESGFEFVNI